MTGLMMSRLGRVALATLVGAGVLLADESALLTAPSGQGDWVTRAGAVIGRPVTPMSYAGVARRTTRRAVAVGAGAAAYSYARPGCVQVVNAYGQITYRCP